MAKVCILGGGFIGRFYAESLCGRRGKDEVKVIYARRKETAERFAKDYEVPFFITDMEEAIFIPMRSLLLLDYLIICTRKLLCSVSNIKKRFYVPNL